MVDSASDISNTSLHGKVSSYRYGSHVLGARRSHPAGRPASPDGRTWAFGERARSAVFAKSPRRVDPTPEVYKDVRNNMAGIVATRWIDARFGRVAPAERLRLTGWLSSRGEILPLRTDSRIPAFPAGFEPELAIARFEQEKPTRAGRIIDLLEQNRARSRSCWDGKSMLKQEMPESTAEFFVRRAAGSSGDDYWRILNIVPDNPPIPATNFRSATPRGAGSR